MRPSPKEGKSRLVPSLKFFAILFKIYFSHLVRPFFGIRRASHDDLKGMFILILSGFREPSPAKQPTQATSLTTPKPTASTEHTELTEPSIAPLTFTLQRNVIDGATTSPCVVRQV